MENPLMPVLFRWTKEQLRRYWTMLYEEASASYQLDRHNSKEVWSSSSIVEHYLKFIYLHLIQLFSMRTKLGCI